MEVSNFLDKHGQDNPNARAKPWLQPAHYTMFVSGDWKTGEKGKDIANAEVMDDMFILYKKFRDIKVTTTNGYTYSTDDICHRGGIPDTEGGPIFPCFTSDTFQCFSEYLEATHPTYQDLDPILDNISALAGNAPFPYSKRPKWRESTPDQIRAEISKEQITGQRGCAGWTRVVRPSSFLHLPEKAESPPESHPMQPPLVTPPIPVDRNRGRHDSPLTRPPLDQTRPPPHLCRRVTPASFPLFPGDAKSYLDAPPDGPGMPM